METAWANRLRLPRLVFEHMFTAAVDLRPVESGLAGHVEMSLSKATLRDAGAGLDAEIGVKQGLFRVIAETPVAKPIAVADLEYGGATLRYSRNNLWSIRAPSGQDAIDCSIPPDEPWFELPQDSALQVEFTIDARDLYFGTSTPGDDAQDQRSNQAAAQIKVRKVLLELAKERGIIDRFEDAVGTTIPLYKQKPREE